MESPLADEVVLNGVNASGMSSRRGQYLLSLSATELEQIAGRRQRYSKTQREILDARRQQLEEDRLALEFGRDENNLAEAGWGIIFPSNGRDVPAIRDALKVLLDWRREQAGGLFKELSGDDGYRPGDTADRYMSRHGASPGTVDPTRLPYYLLIVGDVDEIPFRFQYELDATYLVGRIHFGSIVEYVRYARSVVAAEQGGLRLPRRAVFFGTAHAGDRATELSSELLVQPLSSQLTTKRPDWTVERVSPAASRSPRAPGRSPRSWHPWRHEEARGRARCAAARGRAGLRVRWPREVDQVP